MLIDSCVVFQREAMLKLFLLVFERLDSARRASCNFPTIGVHHQAASLDVRELASSPRSATAYARTDHSRPLWAPTSVSTAGVLRGNATFARKAGRFDSDYVLFFPFNQSTSVDLLCIHKERSAGEKPRVSPLKSRSSSSSVSFYEAQTPTNFGCQRCLRSPETGFKF